MSRANLIMTLGRVIIAAAWADGEVANEEVNSLKDLLFRLPELNARQWASLEMYIEAPVDPAERALLIQQLQAAIVTPQDKALAVSTLREMINADGVITEDEERVFEEIKAAINSVDVNAFNQLSKLIRGPVQRRSAAVAGTPNRAAYFEDFIRNKVYYGVRRRLELGEADLNIPEDDLWRLTLLGGLMAQVARVNREISEGELGAMVDALMTHWSISREAATFVTEVAISESAQNMDYFRLARELVNVCDHDDLLRFLDVLFAIAAADGMASHDEIEEIRGIARNLKLTNEQFIQAKLKIPADKRAN
ncbi:MAG: hypothetical protein GYB67_10390 [Chloroflexi bacterium]|nr:hypothetical protein [Chloroflexota bacterium]